MHLGVKSSKKKLLFHFISSKGGNKCHLKQLNHILSNPKLGLLIMTKQLHFHYIFQGHNLIFHFILLAVYIYYTLEAEYHVVSYLVKFMRIKVENSKRDTKSTFLTLIFRTQISH